MARIIQLSGSAQDELGADFIGVESTARFVSDVVGRNVFDPSRISPTGTVVFEVQPNVTEAGSAVYTEIGNIRQAASILIYQGSPSRTFSIEATFASRSVAEATRNARYINLLRSWRMPEKKSTGFNSDISPPSRLFLSGLGNQFNRIAVRMTDLNIPFPEDVDYIRTESGFDIPIVISISITLKEARSIQELAEFNISAFREGRLDGW